MKRLLFGSACAVAAFAASAAEPVDQGHFRPRASLPASTTPPAATPEKPFFDRWREGWFWYEDPLRDRKSEDKLRTPAASSVESASAQLARIQKDLEEAQAKAVLDPTEPNVRAWLSYNNWMQSSAARFGEVAQKVLWQSPALDNTVAQPVNHLALAQFRSDQSRERDDAMRALGTTHALVFFMKGDCPYCHKFAPILRDFAARVGLTVFPVSLDGGGLPEYPEPRVEHNAATRFGVEVVPAVFLVEPRSGERTPIAFGVVSAEELAERLYTITRRPPPAATSDLLTVRALVSPVP